MRRREGKNLPCDDDTDQTEEIVGTESDIIG